MSFVAGGGGALLDAECDEFDWCKRDVVDLDTDGRDRTPVAVARSGAVERVPLRARPRITDTNVNVRVRAPRDCAVTVGISIEIT